MKSLNQTSLIILLVAGITITAFAQSPLASPETKDPGAAISETRPAKILFEEANSYMTKRFEEFNKEKLPYDQKLEAQTKQEQKELAAKNIASLQARKPLAAG